MQKISSPSCLFAIYIIWEKLISAFQQIHFTVQFLGSIVKMMFLHVERNNSRHFQDAWLYMKYPAHVQTASCAVLIDKCFVPTVTYSSELLGPVPEDCSNPTQHFACNFFSLVKVPQKGAASLFPVAASFPQTPFTPGGIFSDLHSFICPKLSFLVLRPCFLHQNTYLSLEQEASDKSCRVLPDHIN